MKTLTPDTVEQNAVELSETFDLFITQTQKLRQSHVELSSQVERINRDLEEKNRILTHKINELHQTKEYLNNTLESITSGVIAVDMNGCITIFNTGAEVITRKLRDEVLGKDYTVLFGEGQMVPPAIIQTLRTQQAISNQKRVMRLEDGTDIIINANTAPICDPAGQVIGALESFSDLTEMLELEEQVRQADRLALVGEMSATVAHHIRNPLGGIEGFALLLEKDLADQPQLKERARNIVDGARSINAIITRMLDFARSVDLSLQHEQIEDIIDSALGFLNTDQLESLEKIQIEKDYGESGVLLADAELLQNVFVALLKSAVQAMPNGGQLKISSRHIESGLEITLQDSSDGLSEEQLNELFKPFAGSGAHGSGLELPIIQKIISAHRGEISVKSEVGTGTRYIIHLPIEKRI